MRTKLLQVLAKTRRDVSVYIFKVCPKVFEGIFNGPVISYLIE